MNNDDKYQKVPLTASIAERVIIELFAGKDPVSRRDIIRKVTVHYTSNGGLVPKGNPVSLFKEALDSLKAAGRARNLHGGYWKILPLVSDSSEEVLFVEGEVAETEVEAESVDDLVENLLTVIKAEIKNLDEEIEALKRQKSDLEENLTKFNRIWQNLSQRG